MSIRAIARATGRYLGQVRQGREHTRCAERSTDGSAEAVRRELLSDACDYAASDEEGWFYATLDGEYDFQRNDQDMEGQTH